MAAPRGRRPDGGWVYIWSCAGRYKIGSTTSCRARRAAVSAQMPYPVAVVAEYRAEDWRTVEKAVHARFRNYRVHGEWFCLSEDELCEVLSWIEEDLGRWSGAS